MKTLTEMAHVVVPLQLGRIVIAAARAAHPSCPIAADIVPRSLENAIVGYIFAVGGRSEEVVAIGPLSGTAVIDREFRGSEQIEIC